MKNGYLGHLDEGQAKKLAAFSKIFESGEDLLAKSYPNHMTSWAREALLLRFLRARKWNLAEAEKMLRSNLEYRMTCDVPALSSISKLGEVFGNPDVKLEDIAQFYPHATIGFDIQGRPVTYKLWGTFEVWNLKKMTTLDNLIRFHIWEQEHLFDQMLEWSTERGYHCETITAIIDIKGMRLRQITKDFLYLVKHMANVDQNHYPERMGCTYIINCPSMFSMVWKGIVPWLDKNTAAKIKILASEKDWKPVLHEHIGIDQLPPLYGGLNTAVDPRETAEFFGVDPAMVQTDLRSGGNSDVGIGVSGPSVYDIFDTSAVNLSDPIPINSNDDTGSRDGASSTHDSDYHSARHANSIDLENQMEAIDEGGNKKEAGYCRVMCGNIPCLRPCYTRSGEVRVCEGGARGAKRRSAANTLATRFARR